MKVIGEEVYLHDYFTKNPEPCHMCGVDVEVHERMVSVGFHDRPWRYAHRACVRQYLRARRLARRAREAANG